MIEVFPVRTPTLPPATHTNCYRVGTTVIDPASPDPDEQDRLWGWLDGRVERIVLTHHHLDHVGGVADLARRSGAPVYAHHDAQVDFPVDVRLADDDVLAAPGLTLRALHTPGHADGHLCLAWEEGGEVIVGDMLAGVGTIVLVGEEGRLGDYLASLARLEALGGVFHPAHGPALPDGAAMAGIYAAHRHLRTRQLRAALAALGVAEPEALAAEVYAGIPGVHLGLAAAQLLTHLRWLAARGEARHDDEGWRLA